MIENHIEELLAYGREKFGLAPEDEMFARNELLWLFKLDQPAAQAADACGLSPAEVLEPLVAYAVEHGIIAEEEASLFDTLLMCVLLPAPSAVIRKFHDDSEKLGVRQALLNFYQMCIDSNYIRMADVSRNILWEAPTEKGNLVITINLSKPEKDNREIARLKSLPQVGYPKCMLCFENIGYHGRLNFPARQTLRFVPVTLDGEQWYMQYSPYVYYNEHCIVFSKEHKPMIMNESTFRKLLDFVDQFPCYFIGSNACLPIVGGSILSHEHFQGGGYEMPMHRCGIRTAFKSPAEGVSVGILDWFNSVIEIASEDRSKALACAERIRAAWSDYSDAAVGVLAATQERHNAITPIVRKKGALYIIDLILRNNRTDEQYPDGIFHAHPEHHNIKKEGIGLIEVMGLFILPGRLQKQCAAMAEYLTGEKPYRETELADAAHPLYVHRKMIAKLIERWGTALTREQADERIRAYINDTCAEILRNTAVFKETAEGQEAFARFLHSCGF